ncbi:MAG: hypothetical protein SVU88_00850 [Candidatus Nanohaloarchaea archaeon]|nr:hypothetical protein [Candidatus Nanohaloarchaea archaeon]
MAESWTDKTVSMDKVDAEEFDGELAHVTVSENGIRVEFRDVEDWKRIRREIGDEKILRQVRWRAVEDVTTETDHLYYPHIDIDASGEEQRIYFVEDEEDLLEECRAAIERFWSAHRERGPRSRSSYSYDPGEGEAGAADEVEIDEEGNVVDEEDAGAHRDSTDGAGDSPETSGEEADAAGTAGEESGGAEDGDAETDDDSVEEVVEEFIRD